MTFITLLCRTSDPTSDQLAVIRIEASERVADINDALKN